MHSITNRLKRAYKSVTQLRLVRCTAGFLQELPASTVAVDEYSPAQSSCVAVPTLPGTMCNVKLVLPKAALRLPAEVRLSTAATAELIQHIKDAIHTKVRYHLASTHINLQHALKLLFGRLLLLLRASLLGLLLSMLCSCSTFALLLLMRLALLVLLPFCD